MGKQRLFAGLAVAGAVAAGVVMGPATASASPAAQVGITGLDCGIVNCSWVFSRNTTNLIAGGSSVGRVCSAVPFPGNAACRLAWASLVVTSKIAKSKNKCTKITWTKVGPPVWTWWPSVDGGSRCK